jgi:acetyl esterase/lipase
MDWGRMTQAQRDAAYNNSAAVADAPTHNAAREAASTAFRAAHPGHLDLSYGPKPRNKWDLFPAKDPNAPCLVFVHGGYWQRFTREQFCNLCIGPYEMGWSVALPGYTLCPEATMTEIAAEIRAALDWLAANKAAHGIGGPVVLSGWSAGGHLAALCLDHPVVAAGFSFAGLFELGPIRDTFLNGALKLTDAEIETLSPLRLPMVPKPMHIAYGTAELPPLVADSRELHRVRSAQHLPGHLIPVAGADHFTLVHGLRDRDGALTRALGSLLP